MKSLVLFLFALCPRHSVKDNNKYKEKENALQLVP